jgi:hypothetical protein
VKYGYSNYTISQIVLDQQHSCLSLFKRAYLDRLLASANSNRPFGPGSGKPTLILAAWYTLLVTIPLKVEGFGGLSEKVPWRVRR